MKLLKKIIPAFAAIMLAACAFAESVDLTLTYKKNRVEKSKIELQQMPDGAKRLVLPAKYMNKDNNLVLTEITSPKWNAKKGDEGWYLFAPVELIEFKIDNGSFEAGKHLTAFGIKTPQTSALAMLKSDAYDCRIAATAKDGNYALRIYVKSGHISWVKKDLIVDFYEMPKNATYADMAKKYRQYKLEVEKIPTLRQRAAERPELKKSVETMLVRVKHGVKPFAKKDLTPQTDPKPRIMNTFADLKNYIQWFKKNGIEELDVHTVGWNKGGHDGCWPQLLPVEPVFGGEAKLREAIKAAQDAGYQITCHTNYTCFFKLANNWDERAVARRQNGKLDESGFWSGGISYRTCAKQIVKYRLQEDMDIIENLGFHGLHHIDVISCITPQICFSKEHYCGREETVEAWKTVMKAFQKRFGGFSSESSFDFAAEYLDFAFYVSAYPKFAPRKNDMITKLVPFWQIAYHGIILSNPFWGTVDPTYPHSPKDEFSFLPDIDTRVLKVIEFGGRPCFYFTNYRKYGLEPVKKMYEIYQPVKHLQWEFIEDHKELADGVFMTEYSDGSQTVCNYTDKPFSYKGETVAAKDFRLFSPSAWRKAKNWLKNKIK